MDKIVIAREDSLARQPAAHDRRDVVTVRQSECMADLVHGHSEPGAAILAHAPIIGGIHNHGIEPDICCAGEARRRRADRLGERWANSNNVPIKEMPADWNRYGNAAGPMRNKAMAQYADAAIVVWDGKSPGSRNMVENMIRQKKPYYIALISGATLDKFL